MRFFIVDDDDSTRAILADIIEDEGLGSIEGEANDGSFITPEILASNKINVLLIDLLMPDRDGIETIREISPFYQGKVIMISQIETKELIGEAYSTGIDYYITKPINRLEVISILNKVKEKILLERSIEGIHASLSQLNNPFHPKKEPSPTANKMDSIHSKATNLLSELGIITECGHRDLLDIIEIMYQSEKECSMDSMSLKEIFEKVVIKRFGDIDSLQKEIKSAEQRVRRAVHYSLEHIASLGVSDFSNPTFEAYASKFFDYEQVRTKMLELQGKVTEGNCSNRVNVKKFIQVLYMESIRED